MIPVVSWRRRLLCTRYFYPQSLPSIARRRHNNTRHSTIFFFRPIRIMSTTSTTTSSTDHNSPNTNQDITSLASHDLVVLTPASAGDPVFHDAMASRSINARLVGGFPSALLQAHSTAAVQRAVNYCRQHSLQVCVRSGGHSWETPWLRGPGTVVLDVGALKDIHSVNVSSRTIQAGPGAEGCEIVRALAPHDLFFPCGHCRGVPLGGFLLGGGYGIGFPKYGMASLLVQEVDVVLADGRLVTARAGSSDPQEQAILRLLRGSYTGFPGVITQYTLGPLPDRPRGVTKGTIWYRLDDWQKALAVASNITLNGDQDAESMETTVILTYAPPLVQETTGVAMVAMVSLMIWAETPDEGLQLWNKYTAGIMGDDDRMLLPLEAPTLVDAADVPSSDSYPRNARYQTQVFMGHQALQELSGAELETVLQPLVDMWLANDKPPPPSHTLLVYIPPHLRDSRCHGGQELALGYTPDFGVQTYAIYYPKDNDDDADASSSRDDYDTITQNQLERAHAQISRHERFHTSLVEGNVRGHGYASGFAGQAFGDVQTLIQQLDPTGVFAGITSLSD